MRYGILILVGCLLMALSLVTSFEPEVVAQTPDGETPANEGVCDALVGATPALHGLCVAFCEAQDCEPDFSLDDPFQNCNPSDRRLLELYNKKKQPGDPEMPCVRRPCPCWSSEELADLRYPAFGDSLSCRKDEVNPSTGLVDGDYWTINKPSYYRQSVASREFSTANGPSYECFFQDLEVGGDNVVREFNITAEEYAVCEEEVDSSGRERGFHCFP